jgi:hypothetical protein
VLAGAGDPVQLAGRDVVAHAVDLVVGEPEVAVLRVELDPDRVADAAREDLAVLAVAVHADDAADALLVVELGLLRGGHVERLAERDVELVVRPDAADAGGVVERLLARGISLPWSTTTATAGSEPS